MENLFEGKLSSNPSELYALHLAFNYLKLCKYPNCQILHTYSYSSIYVTVVFQRRVAEGEITSKKENPFPLAFLLSHPYNTLFPLLPASLNRRANNSHQS
jgi:hypothetical protein